MAEGIHRDDLPMDVAEEVTEKLKELYPGFKVVFAGDTPGGPEPEVQEKIDLLCDLMFRSFVEGRCFDCGQEMPGWPPAEDSDDWKLPDGWGHYSNAAKRSDPGFFVCPSCEKAEE